MWYAYSLLEKGEKVIITVNDKRDLNTINYFLSKHRLTEISKIFDHKTLIDIGSENSVYGLYMNGGNSQEIETKLLNHIDRVVIQLKELKAPCHNRMNIIQLSEGQLLQSQHYTDSKVSQFDILIDNNELPAIKKTLSEAQQLYNHTFRHIARFDPFKEGIFEEDLASIKMFLTNMISDIDAIIDEFNSIEAQISSCYQEDQLVTVTEINDLRYDISMLKNIDHSEYNHTYISKLKFNIEKIASIIDEKIELSDNINDVIESTHTKIKSYIENLNASTNERVENQLKIVTVHNSEYDIKSLQAKVNKIIQNINEIGIFDKVYNFKAVSFYNLRSIINQVSNDISFAIYFIEENKAYITWLNYLKRLSHRDRKIVNQFLNVKSSWEDSLAAQLATKGIQEALLRIQSVPQSLNGLYSVIEDYMNTNHSIFAHLDKYNNIDAKLEVHFNPDYSEMSTLMRDSILIGLNHVPRLELQGHGLRLFSYLEEYSDIEQQQIRKLTDLEILTDRGIYQLITGKMGLMKSNDHNRTALYLGQALHNMNSAYVILKLKYVTIISFLSELKNVQLRESLYQVGVKEIFSNIENYNFLPGIFSDIESQPVVLLEDGLIDNSSIDNIIRQVHVKEEMNVAGIHIIDIDNYNIVKGDSSIQLLSDKIIAMNHSNEPVFT